MQDATAMLEDLELRTCSLLHPETPGDERIAYRWQRIAHQAGKQHQQRKQHAAFVNWHQTGRFLHQHAAVHED